MSRIRPHYPARFSVVVDRQFELAVPTPHVVGRCVHLVVERAGGVALVAGSPNLSRPPVPEGWTALGLIHVAAGQASVKECDIEALAAPEPQAWPVPRGTPCAHLDAVPVKSLLDDEILAALCPRCDRQLPAEWLDCAHENTIDISALGDRPGQFMCTDCGGSGWPLTRSERMSA